MHFRNLEKAIDDLIENGRLGAAFGLLKSQCIKEVSNFPELVALIAAIDKDLETYRYMSEYLMQNIPDDNRNELYYNLKDSLRILTGAFLFIANSENSDDSFFSSYRLQKFEGKSLSNLLEIYKRDLNRLEKAGDLEVDKDKFRKVCESDLDKIFNKVMTLAPGDDQIIEAKNYALQSDFPYELAAQIVSSLTLGLLRFYDKTKLLALIDIYESSPLTGIQARSLYSIILSISKWSDYIAKDSSLLKRIELLADSILNYTRLRDVVMVIIRTRDTARVNRKIEETFKATMQTFNSKEMREFRDNMGNLDPMELEENPEWRKLMEESGLQEKMMDINEMQMQGMDVMMQAFSKLKNFPFFRTLSNWFLPFSTSHSSIIRVSEMFDPEILDTMGKASDMCGNDKYSFMLSLAGMPPERVQMMSAQLDGAIENFKEELKSRALKSEHSSDFNTEMLGYARDLYRFMKLYPNRKDFTDVYENVIDFCNLPGLGNLLSENEVVKMVGEFYFTYGYYSESLPLLRILEANGQNDMHLYEKIGYCLQVLGNHNEALANYEKADLFSSDANPSSQWLIRKIALCNRILGRYNKAAEYYEKALEKEPENMSLLITLANVKMLASDIDGAARILSKALYLEPENPKIILSNIRVSIMSDNLTKATELTNKLLGIDDSPENRRMAAIIDFLNSNMKNAANNILKGFDGTTDKTQYVNSLFEELKALSPKEIDKVKFNIIADNAFLTLR